jgi:malate dehydrogenase (quinone)
MNRIESHVNVAVVGGGIVGGALVKVLTEFTNIPKIAIFEMGGSIGNLNSNVRYNSGTLHDSSTEHYDHPKSEIVCPAVGITETYFTKHVGVDPNLYRKGPKLLLGVGEEECRVVTNRYNTFLDLHPHMQLIDGAEIARREPNVMKGRNPKESVIALSNDGYTVDFGLLAQYFVKDAVATGRLVRYMNTRIMERQITRIGDKYLLTDAKGFHYTADVVIFATGAYGLIAAKTLGLGQHLGILPIGGNFYDSILPLLAGKVYTVQNPKRPFAAVHGDAEMHNPNVTRFGPTAIVLPTLVDGDWSTVADFLRVSVPTWNGVAWAPETNGKASRIKRGESNYSKERSVGKQVNFACVYNVGPETLSINTGFSRSKSEKLIEAYWERNWAVKTYANSLEVKTSIKNEV